MSRIDELKKQYPELSISLFDLIRRMDKSKTYKYSPLLCKILGDRFNPYKEYKIEGNKKRYKMVEEELTESLTSKGISVEDCNLSELFMYTQFVDFFANETYTTLNEFMDLMDRNKVENKDVTSYPDIESVRTAVSLAHLKELDKDMESQVIKEHEDEKWLIVRPLTFSSSAKYGASTRWCTTYQKEKQYFRRYWKNGILVYFINKETGYKFAGYKSLTDGELSFWNSADQRVDYMDVDADDYLFPIVKRILSSRQTNKELCSQEVVDSVDKECTSDESYPTTEEVMVEEAVQYDDEPSDVSEELPVNNRGANISWVPTLRVIDGSLEPQEDQITQQVNREMMRILEIDSEMEGEYESEEPTQEN